MDDIDAMLAGLEAMDSEEILREAERVKRQAAREIMLSFPMIPTGPITYSPVYRVPVTPIVLTKAEKAVVAAEKREAKVAAKEAKLVLALKHITELKAYIRSAGLKVPALSKA
jgi:hypothetical protein